jgi:phosphoglycolate phosphatase-like HAD superfamily hydrolase
MPILADLATDVMGEVYGTPRGQAREMYIATCGLPFVQQLEEIYPGDARNAGASAEFEGRKPARCASARMSSSTVAALNGLRSLGVRVVVSSNNGQDNVEAFERRNADSFQFDLALGFGAGLCKGAPHLDRVSRTFGIHRSEMLFCGDSLHDGDIARRAEVSFVGVAGTFSRERFLLRFPAATVVSSIAELANLF